MATAANHPDRRKIVSENIILKVIQAWIKTTKIMYEDEKEKRR